MTEAGGADAGTATMLVAAAQELGGFARTNGLAVAPAEFRDFAQPGFAKVVWTFSVEEAAPGSTRLVTETRVACLDAGSRRRFRLYWLVVRPFSGALRKAMLNAVVREAARSQV